MAKAAETFDTPIPDELRARYDAWYAQLPKNLQYTGDYDLQGAWLERLGRPDRYEATQNGHLDDYGKKPNHITFSTGSKWHDPKVPERAGGEWKQAEDGSWDFYPGTGNKASDDELKAYFDRYEKGNRVHRREARQDAKGGDSPGPETTVSETPVSETPVSEPAPQTQGGPRIVINPSTFRNRKDALCVAFNEAFRVVMEDMEFNPVSEPTGEQRKFFSDTAYAGDELQLRRTILARICTFDTSVKRPTDEQLQEAVEFLEGVMESGYPQSEWEQSAVQRIHDVIASVPMGQGEAAGDGERRGKERTPEDGGAANADIGGGDAEDDTPQLSGTGGITSDDVDAAEDAALEKRETSAATSAVSAVGTPVGARAPEPGGGTGNPLMQEGKVYVDYAKSAVSGGGGLTDDAGGLLGEFRKKGQNDESDTGVAPLDPGELRRTFRTSTKGKKRSNGFQLA